MVTVPGGERTLTSVRARQNTTVLKLMDEQVDPLRVMANVSMYVRLCSQHLFLLKF